MLWCHWWPNDWSVHFPATSDRWYLRHRFSRWTASTLRECFCTNTYYQHEGAPPHFSQVVRQYLNHKFPNRWIGRGGAPNWPTRSPDLNPLDYRVWGHMKPMVYAQKVNAREEQLQQILSAATSINNAAVPHKFTSSGHTSQKMHPSRRRTLRTICLSVEWQICNCTFNSIAQ